jgi:hypothetical protein
MMNNRAIIWIVLQSAFTVVCTAPRSLIQALKASISNANFIVVQATGARNAPSDRLFLAGARKAGFASIN